ncbi:hypothetical protein V5799_016841 [Amblyomma americanum]|uniref:Gtpase rho n=1 Tax=Amblyomma americanum TaxID=6943 RepID=A0AAQ4F405_AMBAM
MLAAGVSAISPNEIVSRRVAGSQALSRKPLLTLCACAYYICLLFLLLAAMLTLKVVVVGSCACGKTTLIRTFLRDDVRASVPAPTVQEVYVGHMRHDGKEVRLVIWDTGDSDLLCDPHRAGCYAEADVVLLCFSVRDIFAGNEVPSRWATEVRHFNPGVPVLLVATQMDLREDPVTVQELSQIKCRPSSVAEGLQLAQKIQAAHYVECSALDLASVRKVFESVLHTCLRTTQARQKKSRWKCCW